MELPDSVGSLILGQKETLNVDFKWSFSIESKSDKKEFAKDVVALSNTIATQASEKAYLILGIRDPRDRDRRQAKMEPPFQPFGNPDRIRGYNRDLQNIVNQHCRPAPNVCYEEYDASEEDLGTVAAISIAKALAYPVETTNMGESHEDGIAWIRTGPGDPGRHKLNSEERDALRFGQFGQDPISTILGQALAARLDHITSVLEAQNLFVLLTAKDPQSRSQALRYVAELRRESEDDCQHQAQVVTGMLLDEDNIVVSDAVQALRQIRHPVAVDSLLHLCNSRVRRQKDDILVGAVAAIGEISPDTTIISSLQELGQAFRTPDSSAELDEEFMEVVRTAIASIYARQQSSENNAQGET